jgi:hypothetical protein
LGERVDRRPDALHREAGRVRGFLPSCSLSTITLAAKLDEKARKAVENDIEAIQAEAKDANPSLPVVEGKLKSVESIVTRAIGIGSTLAPIVQKLLELGQHLFK